MAAEREPGSPLTDTSENPVHGGAIGELALAQALGPV